VTLVLAVSQQQRIGAAVVVVMVLGWLIYLVSTARRGPEPGSEVELAPNRRPYLDDDALEGPKLDRSLLWALGFLMAIAVALPVYWLHEPARQAGAGFDRGQKWFDREAVARGNDLFHPPPPPSDPGSRKPHFACSNCHGQKGEGGVASFTLTDPNNKDAPPRQVQWSCPPLNTVLLRFRPDEVVNVITYGRAGTPMPAWGLKGGGPMNDQQISDLLAYLQSIQLSPKKALAEGAKAGTDGKAVFETFCARCHTQGWSYGDPGVMGGGAFGPNLTNGEGPRQFPSIEQQIDWVTNTADYGKQYGVRGQSHGIMPHFGNLLSPAQIKAVVDYERSL
jgi:mono/diheme cytochrome c family protein